MGTINVCREIGLLLSFVYFFWSGVMPVGDAILAHLACPLNDIRNN